MPSYLVKCINTSCKDFDNVVEVWHSIKDDHQPCPLCQTKLVTHFSKESSGAVFFKGSNWFSNGGAY